MQEISVGVQNKKSCYARAFKFSPSWGLKFEKEAIHLSQICMKFSSFSSLTALNQSNQRPSILSYRYQNVDTFA